MRAGATLIIIFLTFYGAHSHATTWFGQACNWILSGGKTPPISKEVAELADAFLHELIHENKYLSFRIEASPERLDFIRNRPESVLFEPALNDGTLIVQPSLFKSFVNPKYIAQNWSDSQPAKDHSPTLLTVFEDVEVKDTSGKGHRLSELMQIEAESIRAHADRHADSALEFQLRIVPLAEFNEFAFKPEMPNLKVMWVDGGNLLNFKLKRIHFLTSFVAFQALLKKPSPQ